MRKRDCGGTTPLRHVLIDLIPAVRTIERPPTLGGPRTPEEQAEREERIARYRELASQGLPLFE